MEITGVMLQLLKLFEKLISPTLNLKVTIQARETAHGRTPNETCSSKTF